jgi:hypothetical protein
LVLDVDETVLNVLHELSYSFLLIVPSCEETAALFVGEGVNPVPYSVEESSAPEAEDSQEEDEEPGLLERLEEATDSLLSR